MNKNVTLVLLLALAAGCTSVPEDPSAPQMDPRRKVSEQDCSRPVDDDGGNLKCREVTEAEREAERRARLAEAERLARARKEALERAARERMERERAEQLAREEAERKARAEEEERLAKLRAAEEARLAAERLRLEAEAAAARKAQEERERKEREEAEARARQLAAQQAREAAERECRRLEQERNEGRALLENFVSSYGKAEQFQEIAGQISAFLDRTREAKPCPPAS